MKLHYKGKFDMNPDSLPFSEHEEGAVAFKEPKDIKQMAIVANVIALITVVLAYVAVSARMGIPSPFALIISMILFAVSMLPHELIHALCFKEDVYLYTSLKNGMLFVTGTERMSKGRFVFMSLLPTLIFGVIPFTIGLVFKIEILGVFGALSLSAGAGDYINVFNALTQMPRGAKCYMHKFNTYWYMEK